MKYQKLKKRDNWGSYEYKDQSGQDVTNVLSRLAAASKTINVRFPDGSTARLALKSHPYNTTVHDWGRAYDVATKIFYLEGVLRGININIPIEEVEVALKEARP